MMLLLTSSATVTARAAFAMTTRTTRPAAATAVAGFGRRRLRMREGAGGRELALQPFRKLNGLVPASDGDARSASPQLPLSAPSSADDDRPWTWSTPSPVRRGRGSTTELAKKPRVNLTVEEVVAAVEAQGATDVRVVDLRGKGTGMGDHFIFCTCTTPLHMRRLADMIVYALKKRKLVKAAGITGAEGYECDDWMLVDCDNLMVHFMLHECREELDLENYWEMARPEEDSALAKKRERGEEGHVEDEIDWEEDFGEEHERTAGLAGSKDEGPWVQA